MRKPKPYIDDEGETRELDDYFFENAKLVYHRHLPIDAIKIL